MIMPHVHLLGQQLGEPRGIGEPASQEETARADVLRDALVHDIHVLVAQLARQEFVANRHRQRQPDELSSFEIEGVCHGVLRGTPGSMPEPSVVDPIDRPPARA